jgi:8-oxo-dGTP diphosphatase
MSVLAAGGIVLRRQQPPLIAVVKLRKRDEWVLPKGKLDAGETARAAARREVLEETGHNVTVHEFLGTLVYDSGGRSKIVHYWRMEAGGEQARELMHDVRAVDWLPFDAAVARLSRAHEQTFLSHVGPQALSAFARRPKAKAPPPRRRRSQPLVTAEPTPAGPAPELALAEPVSEAPFAAPIPEAAQPEVMPEQAALAESPAIAEETVVAEMPVSPAEPEVIAGPAETEAAPARPPASEDAGDSACAARDSQRKSLAQKVRDWLGRAA